jgi:hypothetical protein
MKLKSLMQASVFQGHIAVAPQLRAWDDSLGPSSAVLPAVSMSVENDSH